jgi:hypothetical protein
MRQHQHLRTLTAIAQLVAGDEDLRHLAQTITNSATEASGAKCGAFVADLANDRGERRVLSARSGEPCAALDGFLVARCTNLFEPVLHGLSAVRSDDIRQDPRFPTSRGASRS